MPDITIVSTSDTPEQVQDALNYVPPGYESVTVTPEAAGEAPAEAAEGVAADAPVTAAEMKEAAKVPAKVEEATIEVPISTAGVETAEDAALPMPKRIGKMTFRLREAERQRDELKRQVDALKSPVAAVKLEQQVPPEPPKFADPRPKVADYEDLELWSAALSDWTQNKIKFDQQVENETAQQRADADRIARETEAIYVQHAERTGAFRATHPDFDAKLQQAHEQGLQLPPLMISFITQSEYGPEVAYELANDPAECTRIASIKSRDVALVALGELQATVRAKYGAKPKAQAPAAVVEKPVVKAAPAARKPEPPPEPITPVRAGTVTSAKSIRDPEISFQDYKKERNKQLSPGR